MAKKPRNKLADYLQYLALRWVEMILCCFPVEANLYTACLLGDIMYFVDKKHRERGLGNLRRSFPDMPEEECLRIARRSMRQFFSFAVEFIFTTRLVRLESWRQFVELKDFQKTLDLLLRKDRGLIMLTGHYGNWEILGYVLATLGFPTTSVARTLDNPYINDFALGIRQRKGQRIVDKRGMTVPVMQAISRNEPVGFIADQNAGSKGLFVDFFGRKASTYKAIGLLAMEHEVPIIVGYARRVEGAFRFHVGVQDIIYPTDWQSQDDPLIYITQRYTTAIESFIRDDPGQYLWIHRRWKTRPKGETSERYD